ncbi:TPA: PAS domain-containing protein, partial [Burkholderia multivorans]|nr:PAS domain-containing protein [Burkholderia multivorans]
MSEKMRTHAGNCATAVMFVAIATVLQALAIRFGGANMPLAVYYPLLAAIAWATSFLFGLIATLASSVLVWTLFLSDPAAYAMSLSERLVRLGEFALIGVLACAVVAAVRHARVTNERARRREAAARAQFEALLNALPDGVIAADTNARLTYVNAAAAALLGCRPDDAAGRVLRDVLQLTDRDGRRVQTSALEHALGGT